MKEVKIMNCTLCKTTATHLDTFLFQNATENIYATIPLPAIKKPVYEQPDEEALHTSFEEAISDRQLAVHSRLSRLSNATLDVQYVERDTDTTFSTGILTKNTMLPNISLQSMPTTDPLKDVSRPRIAWRRPTVLACSAVAFALLGFDFMGLLMLHLH
jgi:hypothetical protein